MCVNQYPKGGDETGRDIRLRWNSHPNTRASVRCFISRGTFVHQHQGRGSAKGTSVRAWCFTVLECAFMSGYNKIWANIGRMLCVCWMLSLIVSHLFLFLLSAFFFLLPFHHYCVVWREGGYILAIVFLLDWDGTQGDVDLYPDLPYYTSVWYWGGFAFVGIPILPFPKSKYSVRYAPIYGNYVSSGANFFAVWRCYGVGEGLLVWVFYLPRLGGSGRVRLFSYP